MRRLTRLTALGLATVASLAAVFLILVTTQLHKLAAQIANNLESVRAAQQIELQLLRYDQASYLAQFTDEPQHGESLPVLGASVWSWIGAARNHVSDGEEADTLQELVERVEEYFRIQRVMLAEPLGPVETYARTAATLTQAYQAVRRLLEINLAQAEESRFAASRLDAVANRIAVALAVLLLLGVATAIAGFEVQVYRPLLELRRSIARFGARDYGVRAAAQGPLEVRQIAGVFNEMAEALHSQRQRQLEFLAGIAHDLRNPLNSMKLGIASLEQMEMDTADEQAQRTLQMVGRQVDVLANMISDLLDASRIEAGTFELNLKLYDLRDIARHSVDLFRFASQQHRLDCELPQHPILAQCDPGRIEQVLNNLISNAIKYSPNGGRVLVRVDEDGGDALISVSDEGIGIAAEDRSRVFEPFQRGARSRKTAPGVGLGLSVAQRIVAAHAGELTVDSTLGQGSTFAMRLRQAPGAAARSSYAEPAQPVSGG